MKPSPAPALRIRGLLFSPGPDLDLGPFDLTVAEGEHVLIVGASGCGKTSLLRLVAGLERPREGSIDLFGTRASDGPRLLLAPEKRPVGMLFQEGALWPHMTAARTLEFVLRRRGVAREDRAGRIRELLATVELEGLEQRLPATLSGGEAQRLSLARALAGDPRLLLLDEPLGPLDTGLRTALMERLRDLEQSLGLTTLHVTHDPAEAAALADRVLHMDGGRLVEGEAG